MAINAYTGLMGGGKSFEVVASVIVPAIEHGRRVVTNIDGINQELIHAFLVKVRKADPDKFGQVVHVTNDDVKGHGFFPDEEDPERESIVKPGDLLCIDEAWRFWGKDAKALPPLHMQFFRMHRHYVHKETGTACDVALIVQAIGDLNPSLRAVVEMTAVMTKLKTLGLTKSYRVDLYEGGRVTKAAKFETYVKRYDKRVFPLYQSYVGGAGKEKAMDKRQNVLKNPRVWIVGGLMLVLLSVSLYGLWWFFKGRMAPTEKTPQQAATLGAPTPPGAPAGGVVAGTSSRPPESPLRVAGEVYVGWRRYIVVADATGRIHYESPELFVGSGLMLQGDVNGQRITTFSGQPPAQQQTGLGGVK
jgi:zona occludens toxin